MGKLTFKLNISKYCPFIITYLPITYLPTYLPTYSRLFDWQPTYLPTYLPSTYLSMGQLFLKKGAGE